MSQLVTGHFGSRWFPRATQSMLERHIKMTQNFTVQTLSAEDESGFERLSFFHCVAHVLQQHRNTTISHQDLRKDLEYFMKCTMSRLDTDRLKEKYLSDHMIFGFPNDPVVLSMAIMLNMKFVIYSPEFDEPQSTPDDPTEYVHHGFWRDRDVPPLLEVHLEWVHRVRDTLMGELNCFNLLCPSGGDSGSKEGGGTTPGEGSWVLPL